MKLNFHSPAEYPHVISLLFTLAHVNCLSTFLSFIYIKFILLFFSSLIFEHEKIVRLKKYNEYNTHWR